MNKTDIIVLYTGNRIAFSEYKQLLSNYYVKQSNFRLFPSQHIAFKFQFNIVMNDIQALPANHPIMIGTNLKANETKASIYLRGFPVRCYGALRLALSLHYTDYTYPEMQKFTPTILKSEFLKYSNSVNKAIRKLRICG
jgi:hypothetical protein